MALKFGGSGLRVSGFLGLDSAQAMYATFFRTKDHTPCSKYLFFLGYPANLLRTREVFTLEAHHAHPKNAMKKLVFGVWGKRHVWFGEIGSRFSLVLISGVSVPFRTCVDPLHSLRSLGCPLHPKSTSFRAWGDMISTLDQKSKRHSPWNIHRVSKKNDLTKVGIWSQILALPCPQILALETPA